MKKEEETIIEETICPACSGDGMVYCYGTRARCCGNFTRHGDCCNNPEPEQVLDCEPCMNCYGSGRVPVQSNPQGVNEH